MKSLRTIVQDRCQDDTLVLNQNETLESVTNLLQIFISNHYDFPVLCHNILEKVLETANSDRGFLACCKQISSSDSSSGLVIMASTDNKYVLDTQYYQHHQNTDSATATNTMHFDLIFQDKLLGVIEFDNTNKWVQSKSSMSPLLPQSVTVILGSALSILNVSHTYEYFFLTMSHELRTPLSGVIGMAKLLKEERSYSSSPASSADRSSSSPPAFAIKQTEYIDVIYNCAFHVLEIVNDMVDFARMDVGNLRLEIQPFDLYQEVNNTVNMMYPNAHKKHLQLDVKIDSTLPQYIIGDAKRFKQVIINLLSNAIKYTDQGSVICHVHHSRSQEARREETHHSRSQEARKGETHHSRNGNRKGLLEVEVLDTGIGIDAANIKTLFEFRTTATTSSEIETNSRGGLGLGLAICKKLTKLMGGDIQVRYSTIGRGTCIYFTVPLQEASKPQSQCFEEEKDVDVNLYRKMHVLIVEDEPSNMKVAIEFLYKLGYDAQHVDYANNGLEAINKCRNGGNYDVILMDLKMNIMDGFQCCRIILNESTSKPSLLPSSTPLPLTPLSLTQPHIIAMTAFVMQEIQQKCKESGMSGFLVKPLLLDELQVMLQVIAKRRNAIK